MVAAEWFLLEAHVLSLFVFIIFLQSYLFNLIALLDWRLMYSLVSLIYLRHRQTGAVCILK